MQGTRHRADRLSRVLPPKLPPAAMTVFAFTATMLALACSAAATPLYRLYQQSMHLTPLMITTVFSVYVVGLLTALLTVGGLSDYVGRKPVILGALLVNVVAMLLFTNADNVVELILARAVQGFCVGTASTALGATIIDTDKKRASVLNSVAPFVGLAAGALGAAALVTFGSDPLHLVYEILLSITVLLIVLLGVMPESTARKPGAWASLRPHVSVPPQSKRILLQLTPANVATWALGGFYLSLMPSIVATTMESKSPLTGGIVVSLLVVVAAIAVAVLKDWPARRMLLVGTAALILGVIVSLLGIQSHQVGILSAGTMIAGIGFGSNFSGTLRLLLPTAHADQRAGLLATFYVQSYLAFSLPAILAGLSVPVVGLAMVAYLYGAAIIALTGISLVAAIQSERKSA